MSTLAVYLEKEKFTIVNDSMSYDDNSNPRGFKTKTKTYPHLRCAINSLGLGHLSRDLDLFMKSLPISDFSYLIAHIKESFFDFLQLDFDKYSNFNAPEFGGIGSLLVMGYSEKEKQLSAHIFYLYKDRLDYIEKDTNENMFFHTGLELEDEELAKTIVAEKPSLNIIEDYLVEILKIQHAKYKLGKNTLPSGLEIHSTILSLNGGFSIKQSIPYRFPTFSKDFITILDNSNNGKN